MNIEYIMKKTIRIAFKWTSILLAFYLVVSLIQYNAETPTIEPGQSAVVFNAEQFASKERVYMADATEEYIFLVHETSGVISAFDWDGRYCFSIVTTSKGNGFPEIVCCGNTLTIIDKLNHVFVYEGQRCIEDYQIESLDQHELLKNKLTETSNLLVALQGAAIVDRDNHVIFQVKPSSGGFVSSPYLAAVIIVGFFAFLFCVIGYIVWQKRKEQSGIIYVGQGTVNAKRESVSPKNKPQKPSLTQQNHNTHNP